MCQMKVYCSRCYSLVSQDEIVCDVCLSCRDKQDETYEDDDETYEDDDETYEDTTDSDTDETQMTCSHCYSDWFFAVKFVKNPSSGIVLCRNCNRIMKEIEEQEVINKRLISVKSSLPNLFSHYPFDFPWEKKSYDPADINNKTDTYWHDPIEFRRKIFLYGFYYNDVVLQIKKLNT